MNKVLIIVRATPQAGVRAREAVDAMLLFSAFAPGLAVLFSGDAVWQLLPGQQADAPGAQPVARMLAALAQYEVEQVYVDRAALAARGLAEVPLAIAAEPLDDAGLRLLFARHQAVITL